MAELDDIEFDREVARKRHLQMLSAIKASGDREIQIPDNGLKEVVEKHLQKVSMLIENLPSMLRVESPNVNVEVNNKEMLQSFNNLASSITKEFSALRKCIEDQPRNAKMYFDRDRNGFIVEPVEIKIVR